jgi:twitching motility protein PilT
VADERDFRSVLQHMVSVGASDLHLKVGAPPTLRIDGVLFSLEQPPCTPAEIQALIDALLPSDKVSHFKHEQELDIAASVPGLARFRVNLCCQRGTVGASFRLVPPSIPAIAELMLPPVLGELIQHRQGMILVTGSTGAGKSTTLAAMIDHINHLETRKVVTIEDPIEYLHRDDRCLIYQREIGQDTHSFAHALRHVLRQDPDIILIGEIRDVETLSIALTAANTGHLVVTTLHTADAVQSIQRILSYYPPHEQDEIRRTVADNLRAVISQRLLPRAGGQGRVAAVEVMINTGTIRTYILDPAKTPLIRDAIQDGVSQYKMQSFDQALVNLVRNGSVTPENAVRFASQPNEVALHLQGVAGLSSRVWSPADLPAADHSAEPPWVDASFDGRPDPRPRPRAA